MTDRELLEIAAKAAGLEVIKHSQEARDKSGYGHIGLYVSGNDGEFISTGWNPLTNDADALSLAVKLSIQIIPGENYVEAVRPSPRLRQTRFCEMHSAHDSPLAATRYAVVRAAAEIGRSVL